MKISKKPTNWILVTVSGNDGYNLIDYILIEFTSQYRIFLRQRVDLARAASHFHNFDSLSFWDAASGWYVYYHEGIEGYLKRKAGSWCFIEFDSKTEFLELKLAFERMEGECMSVFGSGTAQMCGTPKHQSAEQFSDEFPLEEILDALNVALGKP